MLQRMCESISTSPNQNVRRIKFLEYYKNPESRSPQCLMIWSRFQVEIFLNFLPKNSKYSNKSLYNPGWRSRFHLFMTNFLPMTLIWNLVSRVTWKWYMLPPKAKIPLTPRIVTRVNRTQKKIIQIKVLILILPKYNQWRSCPVWYSAILHKPI